MTRDPRSHRRYVEARRAWLAGYQGSTPACCLCGQPVRTDLPGTHAWGPTIEHRHPIRAIRAQARTYTEAVALACDTSLWGIAHRRCQAQQGARAVNATRARQWAAITHHNALRNSRRW